MLEWLKKHQIETALAFYFVFRFVFPAISIYGNVDKELVHFGELAAFCITLILIISNRSRLFIYKIDLSALLLILLFRPLDSILMSSWGMTWITSTKRWGGIAICVLSFLVLIVFIIRRKDFVLNGQLRENAYSILLGIVGGIIGVLIISVPIVIYGRIKQTPMTIEKSSFMDCILMFAHQTGYAAVYEEPIFRGFLWGYLESKGLKEVRILLIQAGLFTLGHFYYFPNTLYSFLFIVPVCSLILGILVKKTKTISSSIVAHGFINGLRYDVMRVLYLAIPL